MLGPLACTAAGRTPERAPSLTHSKAHKHRAPHTSIMMTGELGQARIISLQKAQGWQGRNALCSLTVCVGNTLGTHTLPLPAPPHTPPDWPSSLSNQPTPTPTPHSPDKVQVGQHAKAHAVQEDDGHALRAGRAGLHRRPQRPARPCAARSPMHPSSPPGCPPQQHAGPTANGCATAAQALAVFSPAAEGWRDSGPSWLAA